jgi:hypothetical protein
VAAEGPHLGVKVGVEPIGAGDGGTQVVQDEALRYAAEVPEGVLQATQERLVGLATDDLAVALARVAQDDAEDVRPATRPVSVAEESALAEVDLRFLAGAVFQSAEGELLLGSELADEAADAVVAAGEAELGDQVLVDALGGQSEVDLDLDGLLERLATTEPADPRACSDSGLAIRFGAVRRAGGRNGCF